MPTLFVATSKSLTQWGSDVGLGKNLYKVGVTEQRAEQEIEAFNAGGYGGQRDWVLLGKADVADVDEGSLLERLGRKEKAVDPTYYPRIKKARGIFKVKPENVENHILVKRALADLPTQAIKIKPADTAAYLIHTALRESRS